MELPVLSILLSTLGLTLFAAVGHAQSGTRTLPPPNGQTPMAYASFTIPTIGDPDSVTFTSSGQTFIKTDQNNAITGSLLDPAVGGGLNIFAAVPAPPSSTVSTIPIVEVDFFTDYTGPLQLTSTSGDPMFDPWFIQRLSPPTGQGFRFFKTQSNQANINTTNPNTDPEEFAYFTITPVNPNPNDPNTALFLRSSFTISGITPVQPVPEPGVFALLGAIAVSGGVVWRRRRTVLNHDLQD